MNDKTPDLLRELRDSLRAPKIRRELEQIKELLSEVYTPKGVEIFLHSRNRMLNMERPIDLIERGDGQRVADLANALAEGMFT